MATEAWLILALAAVGAAWHAAMRAREQALAIVRQCCEQAQLQLLDDTVALTHLRPARDPRGRLAWRRIYLFEYLQGAPVRRQGTVILLGARLEALLLETAPGLQDPGGEAELPAPDPPNPFCS